MSLFSDWVLAHANTVAYWPLTKDLLDRKGTNHMIAADVLNGHGNFAINADPFFSIGGSWTIAGGVASAVDAGVGTRSLGKNATVVAGKSYIVVFTVSAVTGGGVQVSLSTTNGTARTAPGTYTEKITPATSGAANITLIAGATATIDNWTVREDYAGNILSDGATFNGVSNSLQSTNSIDLSGTNKITVLANIRVITYDLVNSLVVIESSISAASEVGSFSSTIAGSVANDPWRLITKGNVGADQAQYFPALTKLDDHVRHFTASTHDMSLAGNESNYYQDGVLLTASARVSINNTGNFGSYILYVGSRAGSSLFSNISISEVALFNTVLTANEIAYANTLLKKSIGLTKRIFTKQN